jgi:hypothetical protein
MTKSRASIFEEVEGEGEEGLDIAGFAPRTAIDPKAPKQEEVRAVAQAAKFQSREATDPKPRAKSKRAPRVHRTGRNVQFNIKASFETVDTFYSLAEKQDWVLGETLERAVEALQRELEKAK